MSHTYHEALPGYAPDQILHDGCSECEERGESVRVALAHLDQDSFRHAWHRAAEWQQHGCPTLSRAEMPLLEALYGVQVHLERCGLPIGQLP